MKTRVELQTNEERLVEVASKVAPDIAQLIAYIVRFNIKPDFLIDVINQAYKIAMGSGSGKVSIVVEDRRVRSVHGIENRLVEKDIFIE